MIKKNNLFSLNKIKSFIANFLLLTFCLLCFACHHNSYKTNNKKTTIRENQAVQTLREMNDVLVLATTAPGGRSAVHLDALESQIIKGQHTPPSEGEVFTQFDGKKIAWESVKSNDKGFVKHKALRGGYASWSFNCPKETTLILKAQGHSLLYINDTIHGGDIYNFGFYEIPFVAKAGKNHILFKCSRGQIKASLYKCEKPLYFNSRDKTLPDIVKGKNQKLLGALIVVNTTRSEATPTIICSTGQISKTTTTAPIPALGMRKLIFELPTPMNSQTEKVRYNLTLKLNKLELDTTSVDLHVKNILDHQNVTFISRIDGSLQYYSVVPAKPLIKTNRKPGIVLTLHGAGVEAHGQAGAYKAKRWCHIVAATNRRKFGFDWEDWGRMDALEVLEHAKSTFEHDPQRVHLTGHSMGGHGTWQIGSHFPNHFASLGPSAGWQDFWNYGGGAMYKPESISSEILTRANNASRTKLLVKNYKDKGIYIIHGDKDDNVPISQAKNMINLFKSFHTNYQMHTQPGAKHWWGSEQGGCVDWPPLFDMMARRRLAAINEVFHVDFTTVNPGINSTYNWVTIHNQIKHLNPSNVTLQFKPNKKIHFEGTTQNVKTFSIEVGALLENGKKITLKIDDTELKDIEFPQIGSKLFLSQKNNKWFMDTEPSKQSKGPHRYGSFKEAFNHNMLYVYGTKGTPEETKFLKIKAKYDAEQFWYRGNGAIDVIKDTEYEPLKHLSRNVILIGNSENNELWQHLLKNSPIQVNRTTIKIGNKEKKGSDLCVLFIQPKPNSENNFVAAISGTGLEGIRLCERMRYFVSGAAFPDFTAYSSSVLLKGSSEVFSAGFFADDWSLGMDWVWK